MKADSLSKSALRKMILQYRRLLDNRVFEKRNEQLISQIKRMLSQTMPHTIHLFLSIERNKEPDLKGLLHWFWANDVRTITSKTDFKERKLAHYEITPNTRYLTNHLGIPEPQDAIETFVEMVDVVFIPLLAADQMGSRLGYGGGFYDRLLKETNAKRIGLCLSPLLDQIKQVDKWDEPLEMILTPNKIWQKQH